MIKMTISCATGVVRHNKEQRRFSRTFPKSKIVMNHSDLCNLSWWFHFSEKETADDKQWSYLKTLRIVPPERNAMSVTDVENRYASFDHGFVEKGLKLV